MECLCPSLIFLLGCVSIFWIDAPVATVPFTTMQQTRLGVVGPTAPAFGMDPFPMQCGWVDVKKFFGIHEVNPNGMPGKQGEESAGEWLEETGAKGEESTGEWLETDHGEEGGSTTGGPSNPPVVVLTDAVQGQEDPNVDVPAHRTTNGSGQASPSQDQWSQAVEQQQYDDFDCFYQALTSVVPLYKALDQKIVKNHLDWQPIPMTFAVVGGAMKEAASDGGFAQYDETTLGGKFAQYLDTRYEKRASMFSNLWEMLDACFREGGLEIADECLAAPLMCLAKCSGPKTFRRRRGRRAGGGGEDGGRGGGGSEDGGRAEDGLVRGAGAKTEAKAAGVHQTEGRSTSSIPALLAAMADFGMADFKKSEPEPAVEHHAEPDNDYDVDENAALRKLEVRNDYEDVDENAALRLSAALRKRMTEIRSERRHVGAAPVVDDGRARRPPSAAAVSPATPSTRGSSFPAKSLPAKLLGRLPLPFMRTADLVLGHLMEKLNFFHDGEAELLPRRHGSFDPDEGNRVVVEEVQHHVPRETQTQGTTMSPPDYTRARWKKLGSALGTNNLKPVVRLFPTDQDLEDFLNDPQYPRLHGAPLIYTDYLCGGVSLSTGVRGDLSLQTAQTSPQLGYAIRLNNGFTTSGLYGVRAERSPISTHLSLCPPTLSLTYYPPRIS